MRLADTVGFGPENQVKRRRRHQQHGGADIAIDRNPVADIDNLRAVLHDLNYYSLILEDNTDERVIDHLERASDHLDSAITILVGLIA